MVEKSRHQSGHIRPLSSLKGHMNDALRAQDMEKAFDTFERIRTLTGRDENSDLIIGNQVFFKLPDGARNLPRLINFEECLVESDYWIVFVGNQMLSWETMQRRIRNHRWVAGRTTPDESTFLVELPKDRMPLEGPHVLLGGDDNYCHWLLRVLTRLWLLNGRRDLKSLPFLMTDEIRTYQSETLKRLEIDEAQCVRLPRNQLFECRDLWLPVCLRDRAEFDPACRWLRGKLLGGREPPSGRRRLYISRRDAQWRRLTNEDELLAALEPLGFEIVVPGDLRFDEQIKLFGEADIVIGAHGAGLTNILFAPATALVLELSDTFMKHMLDFRHVARAVGQEYRCVVSDQILPPSQDGVPPSPSYKFHDFRIDVPVVLQLLNDMIR